jgi:hypothetical protein
MTFREREFATVVTTAKRVPKFFVANSMLAICDGTASNANNKEVASSLAKYYFCRRQ